MRHMKNIYNGELWFAGWKSDHKGKRQVIFELPDDEALECFKGMTARKGNMAGQILMAALVEIGENEESIIKEPIKSKTIEESNGCDHENYSSRGKSPKTGPVPEKLKGGPLSKLAGMWCHDPNFSKFVQSIFYECGIGADPSIDSFIKLECGIKSKIELDHDSIAAEKFHKIRHRFIEWTDAQDKT